MNYETNYLITTLRCFIQKEKLPPFTGDWQALLQLSSIHSVTGILGYMVMNNPEIADPEIQGYMRQQCFQTIGIFSQRAEFMKQLIQLMNEAEIDHLLFKGFVLRDYYPEPELRTFGDVDFLIRVPDRAASDALMTEKGFSKKTDWEPVYTYIKGMEVYEIHTDVMEVDVSDKADYVGYFSHTWERAKLVDGHTYMLSPEDHLIYLLTHIAKHVGGSGAGIRLYMDIAVFLKHFEGQLDWAYLNKEFLKLNFTDFANMVFLLVKNFFGVFCPEAYVKEVDDTVVTDFMDFTMEGGTFGHYGRDLGTINLKNQDRSEESVSKFKTFRRRLFPSVENMVKRYTYLQKCPWLLPFAWVHRFFKTRATWGLHAKEVQDIINADTEEVLKYKRLYKEIGL